MIHAILFRRESWTLEAAKNYVNHVFKKLLEPVKLPHHWKFILRPLRGRGIVLKGKGNGISYANIV